MFQLQQRHRHGPTGICTPTNAGDTAAQPHPSSIIHSAAKPLAPNHVLNALQSGALLPIISPLYSQNLSFESYVLTKYLDINCELRIHLLEVDSQLTNDQTPEQELPGRLVSSVSEINSTRKNSENRQPVRYKRLVLYHGIFFS